MSTSAARRKAPRQRLARSHASSRSSDLALTVGCSVAIALPLLFYLHQHAEMLRYGYEIDALRARRAALVEQRRQLRVQRSVRLDLKRIEERALELGLVRPASLDVFSFKGGARTPREGLGELVTRTTR